jgi:hypothetical protein
MLFTSIKSQGEFEFCHHRPPPNCTLDRRISHFFSLGITVEPGENHVQRDRTGKENCRPSVSRVHFVQAPHCSFSFVPLSALHNLSNHHCCIVIPPQSTKGVKEESIRHRVSLFRCCVKNSIFQPESSELFKNVKALRERRACGNKVRARLV